MRKTKGSTRQATLRRRLSRSIAAALTRALRGKLRRPAQDGAVPYLAFLVDGCAFSFKTLATPMARLKASFVERVTLLFLIVTLAFSLRANEAIQSGPTHWSFTVLEKPAVPGHLANPID